MQRHSVSVVAVFLCIAAAGADTFTHLSGESIYTGYVSKIDKNGLSHVQTVEAGEIELNLSEFRIEPDFKGRNPFVSVLTIDGEIVYEIETAAFESALIEEAAKGPLFILIEIDTPGGRVDLARRLCAAVSELRNAQTVAFIKGEKNLGAYSAGAAVSLACDRIYLAPNTAIGAATAVVIVGDEIKTEKEAFGEEIGEKFGSAWRNYLAALALSNGKSGLLAKAMEDKDITVLEVDRNGKILYIEPDDQRPGDKLLEVFCKKGELLTLSPPRALRCGIADGIAATRADVIRAMGAPDARIEVSTRTAEARAELEEAHRKIEKLADSLDLRFKALKAKSDKRILTKNVALKDYKQIIRELDYLMRLKKQYSDVGIEDEHLQDFLNEVKAEYQSIQQMR